MPRTITREEHREFLSLDSDTSVNDLVAEEARERALVLLESIREGRMMQVVDGVYKSSTELLYDAVRNTCKGGCFKSCVNRAMEVFGNERISGDASSLIDALATYLDHGVPVADRDYVARICTELHMRYQESGRLLGS